jgi:hypothetical protein
MYERDGWSKAEPIFLPDHALHDTLGLNRLIGLNIATSVILATW